MAKRTVFSGLQALAHIFLKLLRRCSIDNQKIVLNMSNFLQKIHKFQSTMRSNLESTIPTFPLSGCKFAVIMFNIAVFPAWFGPKIPKISPLSTIILMSFTTLFFLNDFFKPWNSSIIIPHLTQSATKLLNNDSIWHKPYINTATIWLIYKFNTCYFLKLWRPLRFTHYFLLQFFLCTRLNCALVTMITKYHLNSFSFSFLSLESE